MGSASPVTLQATALCAVQMEEILHLSLLVMCTVVSQADGTKRDSERLFKERHRIYSFSSQRQCYCSCVTFLTAVLEDKLSGNKFPQNPRDTDISVFCFGVCT